MSVYEYIEIYLRRFGCAKMFQIKKIFRFKNPNALLTNEYTFRTFEELYFKQVEVYLLEF